MKINDTVWFKNRSGGFSKVVIASVHKELGGCLTVRDSQGEFVCSVADVTDVDPAISRAAQRKIERQRKEAAFLADLAPITEAYKAGLRTIPAIAEKIGVKSKSLVSKVAALQRRGILPKPLQPTNQ